MMTRLARCSALIFCIVILATYLPRFFWQALSQDRDYVGLVYSHVDGGYLQRVVDRLGNVTFTTEDGTVIDRKTYERKLPIQFRRDLIRWKEMPKEINGVSIDPKTFFRELQLLRLRPSDLKGPAIPLYSVLESASEYTDLAMPDDYMRFAEDVTVIRCKDNTIDEETSALFTAAFIKEGFRFPCVGGWGNPTTRKLFDWGWFLLDSEGSLFHLMRVKGQPRLRKTGMQPASGVQYIMVDEDYGRRIYGLLVDGENRVHTIGFPDYHLSPLPLSDFDPLTTRLSWFRDPVGNRFTMEHDDFIRVKVTDHNGAEISQKRIFLAPVKTRMAELAADFLLPFQVRQTKDGSRFLTLRIQPAKSPVAFHLVRAVVFLFLLLLWRRKNAIPLTGTPEDWILVATTGVFGILAVVWAGEIPGRRNRKGGNA